MADIDDDQERGAAFRDGQGAAIEFGLAAGAEHGVVPGGGAAPGGAEFEFAFQIAGGL